MTPALTRIKAYLDEHQRRTTAPRSTMDKETIHAFGLGSEIIKLTAPDLAELVARVVALEEVVRAADVLRESVDFEHDPSVQLVRDQKRYEAARAKLEGRA